MNESRYQAKLVEKLRDLFPGCHIERGNSQRRQGVPDLLILFRDKWAMLEVKASSTAPYQPNQEHYIQHFSDMSFCAVVYPENEAEVLDALQKSFGIAR